MILSDPLYRKWRHHVTGIARATMWRLYSITLQSVLTNLPQKIRRSHASILGSLQLVQKSANMLTVSALYERFWQNVVSNMSA